MRTQAQMGCLCTLVCALVELKMHIAALPLDDIVLLKAAPHEERLATL